MKCFDHQDRDAIGTCKSCCKGLCPECAVDLTHGLACKGRCEEEVQSLIRLIQNNIKLAPTSFSLIRASRRTGLFGSSFLLILGSIFAFWGLHDHMSFATTMGGCFVLFGIINAIRVLRMTAPPE